MNNKIMISITGKNPSFFIKRYVVGKINYSCYKEVKHNKINIMISYDDYLILKQIKSTYEIEIVKMFGFNKLLFIIKNNYTFIISFFISILFLFLISNTIFDVDIVHNDSDIRNIVRTSLKENNIDKLKIIPSFDKRKKIVEKIIEENKDSIEWLEIERKGSKLIVKVTERRINKKQEDDEPRHIIAKKSGIITKIEASSGVILKKKNDYVSKGEIIISGDVIKDDTVKGQVHANGVVYAETWYNVNVEYPLSYKEVIYLADVKNNLIINFLGKDVPIRKNYASSYLEKKHVLIKSKIMPFSIRVEKQRKTKTISKKYTQKKALELAIKLAEEKIKSKLDTDEYIISKKTLNLSSDDSKIEVDVFFKVNENITDYKEVDKSLLENNDEIRK